MGRGRIFGRSFCELFSLDAYVELTRVWVMSFDFCLKVCVLNFNYNKLTISSKIFMFISIIRLTIHNSINLSNTPLDANLQLSMGISKLNERSTYYFKINITITTQK